MERQEIIEAYLPDYYTNEEVLRCDILTRYCDNEEVSAEDLALIDEEFDGNTKLVRKEIRRIEGKLYAEAMREKKKGAKIICKHLTNQQLVDVICEFFNEAVFADFFFEHANTRVARKWMIETICKEVKSQELRAKGYR